MDREYHFEGDEVTRVDTRHLARSGAPRRPPPPPPPPSSRPRPQPRAPLPSLATYMTRRIVGALEAHKVAERVADDDVVLLDDPVSCESIPVRHVPEVVIAARAHMAAVRAFGPAPTPAAAFAATMAAPPPLPTSAAHGFRSAPWPWNDVAPRAPRSPGVRRAVVMPWPGLVMLLAIVLTVAFENREALLALLP